MQERTSRRSALTAIGTLLVAGCTGRDASVLDDEESEPNSDGDSTTPDSRVEATTLRNDFETVWVGASPPSDEPENAPPFGERVLPVPMSPAALREHAVDGGPPKDGIPSIDDPSFRPADGDEFLSPESPVVGVVGPETTKAYPRRILLHHEIVNDVVDGVPVSVTYCPLTGTAVGFERGETTFGVSGVLINNNLVMYDRTLERWWPQIPAVSIPGPWHDTRGGATLREFSLVRTTWERWRERYPETVLMSDDTGYVRSYVTDPYGNRGYYRSDDTIFENIYTNDRHHAKAWVYGARTSDGAVAFLKESLRDAGIVHGAIDDRPVVAVYDPSLDTAYVYRNPDETTFVHESGSVVDEAGDVHAPEELPLERVLAFDAFWFAWVSYYPNTVVYE